MDSFAATPSDNLIMQAQQAGEMHSKLKPEQLAGVLLSALEQGGPFSS